MRNKVDSVNIKQRASRRVVANKTAYHHGSLRAALVKAGLSALENSAQGELSLRALARSVGVTVNAAYRHFADKEAVLCAVAAEGFRRFNATQRRAMSKQSDPQQAMLALGQAYIRFALRNPALFRLMFGRFDGQRQDEELEQASQAAFRSLQDCVAQSLALPIDDPHTVNTVVRAWALVHGLSHLLLDGQLDRLPAKPQELVAAALSGMNRKAA